MSGVKGKSGVYERTDIQKEKHRQNCLGEKNFNYGGKSITDKSRIKMRLKKLGTKQSEIHKKNISKAKMGEKSNFWQGGIWNNPYTVDWTKTLRKSIRERDNYICQICSQYGNSVHHIDYNKKNCNPNNLITLCRKCHSKTNHNRKCWIAFFTKRDEH